MLKPGVARFIAVVVPMVAAVACAGWCNVFTARRVLSYLPWCRRRARIDDELEVALTFSENALAQSFRELDFIESPTELVAEMRDSVAPLQMLEAAVVDAPEALRRCAFNPLKLSALEP